MAKKEKRPKCPHCKIKLKKARGKEELVCKECGHEEPILQVTGEIKPDPIPKAKDPEKTDTEQSQALSGKDAKITIYKDQDGNQIDKNAEAPGPSKPKAPPGQMINRGIQALPKVMLYCWNRGPIRGYAYGIACPYPSPEWKKEVTGVQAYQFLLKVKRANKQKRLESAKIIRFN